MTFAQPKSRTFQMACLALSSGIVLNATLQRTNGTLEETSIYLLLTVMFLSLLGLGLPGLLKRTEGSELIFGGLTMAGVAWFFALSFTTLPAVYMRAPDFTVHHRYAAVAAVASGLVFVRNRWLSNGSMLVILICYLGLGLWLLEASPQPSIDVFVWHQGAYRALAEGLSPYSITIPNIYGHTLWYAPGSADASTVYVGYVYPPLTLALGALGYVFKSDHRYANLLFMAAVGGIIAWTKPHPLARAAAIVFLFAPRMLFVLEQSWTEASALFMFALLLWSAVHRPKLVPYIFGATLATKQYFVLLLPFAPFLLESTEGKPFQPALLFRFLAKATGVGLLCTLPLALWDFKGFWYSVVVFQGIQPFRADALSLMSWTALNGVPRLPMWFSFAAAAGVSALAWWRGLRNVNGFAMASSVSMLFFFAVAKQAFCNYYFLVAGMFCVTAAVLCAGEREEEQVGGTLGREQQV
jgi:hypothetical protein